MMAPKEERKYEEEKKSSHPYIGTRSLMPRPIEESKGESASFIHRLESSKVYKETLDMLKKMSLDINESCKKFTAKDKEAILKLMIKHNEEQKKKRMMEMMVEKVKKAKTCVDILLFMDCTSSMSPWIKEAKDILIKLITDFKVKFGHQFTFRVGFVGYRDFHDAKQFVIEDFNLSVETIQKTISNTEAIGGDDWAEDVIGALNKGLKLSISK